MIRLKNPSIILTPITEEEKDVLTKEFCGDMSIYVLYRRPMHEGIQIGMLSSSMRTHFSSTANYYQVEESEEKAYFYNGCSDLERIATEVTDRPVYKVRPNDDRTVAGYDVLNGTKVNNLRIWLEDILDGSYKINPEPVPVLERTAFKKTI